MAARGSRERHGLAKYLYGRKVRAIPQNCYGWPGRRVCEPSLDGTLSRAPQKVTEKVCTRSDCFDACLTILHRKEARKLFRRNKSRAEQPLREKCETWDHGAAAPCQILEAGESRSRPRSALAVVITNHRNRGPQTRRLISSSHPPTCSCREKYVKCESREYTTTSSHGVERAETGCLQSTRVGQACIERNANFTD